MLVPPQICIDHILVLTSPNVSHEPVGPKSDHQEPIGSTPDFLTIVPKDTCQKSNCKELVASTYDRSTLVIKKIPHVRTQNKIIAPSIIMHMKQTSRKSLIVCISSV